MCGILFILWTSQKSKEDREEFIGKIRDRVASRGPESHSHVQVDNIDIIFHRLATYGDLNQTNMMPIKDKEGTYLVCNGDIYNYKYLTKQILYEPQTQNDCEIIIPVVNIFKETSPTYLRGVFGTVMVNPHKKELTILRGAFGVRPLFRLITDEAHIYSSDMRVIMGLQGIKYELQEIPPGSYERFHIEPWREPRRIVQKTWLSLPKSPDISELITDQIIDSYSHKVHDALVDAIKVRIQGCKRPFGCLVSGGLDSSLVAGILYRKLPLNVPLYTYSIGMRGATDEKYAREVADYLGTHHTHFEVSKGEMLGAIDNVIEQIGSYDTTTVRASIGNYLICRKIKEKGECVYLFNGDGADELMGGYLYFNSAPDADAFDGECRRLLQDIYKFDVLRSDRSIGGNGLAPRTPYLDIGFVREYLQIPAKVRWAAHQRCEKFLIRNGCRRQHYIPPSVLWRRKEAMSDGVSSQGDSWHTTLQNFADERVVGRLEDQEEYSRQYNPPRTKEQVLYRRIYESKFGTSDSVAKATPYFWMPRFVEGATDASARTLAQYNQKNGKQEQG